MFFEEELQSYWDIFRHKGVEVIDRTYGKLFSIATLSK